MPIGWHNRSSPEMGDRAQALINKQVLIPCDLLVAIFGARLGTDTGKHESGTVEEIKEHMATSEPVMIYFSRNSGDPGSYEADQFLKLQAFRTWCAGNGLYETYGSIDEFEVKFRRQLALKINDHEMFETGSSSPDPPFSLSIVDEEVPISASEHVPPPYPDLGKKSKVMLKLASLDPSGYILVIQTLGGTAYQVNNDTLNLSQERRELAQWDESIDQLIKNGLIKQKPTTGKGLRMFEMSSEGYKIADRIDEGIKDWIA